MTPNDNQVALPELPEWSGEFMAESEFAEAAQAYALEAVRMNQPTAGEAAAVSKENFNEEIGQRISRDNARSKVRELEGYLLQEKLAL